MLQDVFDDIGSWISAANSYALLGCCLLYTFVVPLLLGAKFSDYAADWYKQLQRPLFAAPDSVFPVVFPIFHLTERWAIVQQTEI